MFVQFVLKHSKSKMPFLRIHSVKLLRIFLPIRFYVKSIFDENVPNLAKKSKLSVFITNDFTKILKGRKNLTFVHCENAVDYFRQIHDFFFLSCLPRFHGIICVDC